MVSTLRKLTLVAPQALEASLTDTLLNMDPPAEGLTVIDARGHGASMLMASPAEQVRGAMNTVMVVTVVQSDQIEAALAAVAAACPVPRLSYWIEPVEDFGRLEYRP